MGFPSDSDLQVFASNDIDIEEVSILEAIQTYQKNILGYTLGDSTITIAEGIDSDAIDDDGYINSNFEFDYSSDYEEGYNYISTGQITLIKEAFYDDNDQLVSLYYPFSYIDDPSISLDTDEDPNVATFSYDSDEEALLEEKYGGPDGIGTSADDLLEYVNETVTTLATDMANTKLEARFIFKKLKHPILDEDNLSSFTKEEGAQGISLSAAYKITEEEEEAMASET
tara:strand:+ start:86 stop:766 length:681 start_codon:yes stop_codon:yes gene_type:complete